MSQWHFRSVEFWQDLMFISGCLLKRWKLEERMYMQMFSKFTAATWAWREDKLEDKKYFHITETLRETLKPSRKTVRLRGQFWGYEQEPLFQGCPCQNGQKHKTVPHITRTHLKHKQKTRRNQWTKFTNYKKHASYGVRLRLSDWGRELSQTKVLCVSSLVDECNSPLWQWWKDSMVNPPLLTEGFSIWVRLPWCL